MQTADKILEDNRALLEKWGIDNRSKVVKLLINHGIEPLEADIARLKSEEKAKTPETHEKLE